MEAKVKQGLKKYLKSKGCFVATMQAGPGMPLGTPDLFFCYEGFYGFLEVKASKKAPFQPYQKETVEKFDDWSFARIVYPENYDEIIAELERIL
jgi:Holliday junction resolvase